MKRPLLILLTLFFSTVIGAKTELAKKLIEIHYKAGEYANTSIILSLGQIEGELGELDFTYVHQTIGSKHYKKPLQPTRFSSVWKRFEGTRLNPGEQPSRACSSEISFKFIGPQKDETPQERTYCLETRPWSRAAKEAFGIYLSLEKMSVAK